MKDVLKSIDYKKVFHYFEEISSVPRGSKDNQGISDYLVQFAKDHNLAYRQDEALNVVMVKEATKGYEDKETVMLQGHMDMVCLAESGVEHDFTKEGLDLYIDGDYIKARGTTLGGDNGIAIAMSLAILDNDELVHPRLEVVITTDEEIGLLGAAALDASDLKAKYLINLDSEAENAITVGCAGGMTSICSIPVEYRKQSGDRIDITIRGLQGGHSGAEITKNRTNSNILMGRMLTELENKEAFEVIHMEGGSKDNAIPNESIVSIVVNDGAKDHVIASIKELEAVYKSELHSAEPGFNIMIEEGPQGEFDVLTNQSFEKILLFMSYTPNGIQVMSADIEGLVESSLNLGILVMDDKEVSFSYSVRSSVASYKEYLSNKLCLLAEFLGGSYTFEGSYPGWEFKQDSKLRSVMEELYEKEFGRKPVIEVIHAGLECGLLLEKMPELDIVSIGPDMNDIHTPQEALSISSTKRMFDFVLTTLEALCK
ncbi:aminoacyl-histidine dipeptidase [Lachnospiraceae bacterium KM106-2]|nr:aminoacyl-histidine dipeptidase [Lachnospiraceae bacterium KM106-2]